MNAANEIGSAGRRGGRLSLRLLDLLADGNPEVRRAAVNALGGVIEFIPNMSSALPRVMKRLSDHLEHEPDAGVRLTTSATLFLAVDEHDRFRNRKKERKATRHTPK